MVKVILTFKFQVEVLGSSLRDVLNNIPALLAPVGALNTVALVLEVDAVRFQVLSEQDATGALAGLQTLTILV